MLVISYHVIGVELAPWQWVTGSELFRLEQLLMAGISEPDPSQSHFVQVCNLSICCTCLPGIDSQRS